MKLVFLFIICISAINARFDPLEFKDYMAGLLDNDKWVHFDSELKKQRNYCFMGNKPNQINKPKIEIRIDDYSTKFHEKMKWFWKTTQNASSKNCFPGWEDMGSECFYFPSTNVHVEQGQVKQNYWDAEKKCRWTYGGEIFQPYDENANDLRGRYMANKFGRNNVQYWIGVHRVHDNINWRFQTTGKKIYNAMWALGEPNNIGGHEKCVRVNSDKKQIEHKNRKYGWEDVNCGQKINYACQAPYIPGELSNALRPYSFAFFMAEIMTNDDWYALLKDLDIFEKDCAIGYMGAYHVDLPYILGLKPNSEEVEYFYFQKTRLYQEREGIHKGPLSLFMSNVMTGRLWTQLILTLNHQFDFCNKKLMGDHTKLIRQRYLIDYIKNGDQNFLHPLWSNITSGLSFLNKEFKNVHLDAKFDDLAKYLNARMDDNGWKLLIEDTFSVERTCSKDKLGNDFRHISWPFYAGVSGDPMQAYHLINILIDMKIFQHDN